MRRIFLYLAGPITGLTYDECTDWRDYVCKKLPLHIQGVSPMRCKEYLKNKEAIKDCHEEHPLSTGKGITTRDRYDVTRCDMLFVNLLEAKTVSIGTVMEIAWADMLRKPIVIVMEKENNLHDHAMIRECAGFIVPTLDEGIEIAIAVLDTH